MSLNRVVEGGSHSRQGDVDFLWIAALAAAVLCKVNFGLGKGSPLFVGPSTDRLHLEVVLLVENAVILSVHCGCLQTKVVEGMQSERN